MDVPKAERQFSLRSSWGFVKAVQGYRTRSVQEDAEVTSLWTAEEVIKRLFMIILRLHS